MAHILLIDDHPDILRLLEMCLRGPGVTISKARNGLDGLAMIRSEKPDLVILDVSMPELDGYRVLHRVRADPDTANVIVILLTVKDSHEDMTVGLDLGADYYLTKPFHPKDVHLLVKRALAARTIGDRSAEGVREVMPSEGEPPDSEDPAAPPN